MSSASEPLQMFERVPIPAGSPPILFADYLPHHGHIQDLFIILMQNAREAVFSKLAFRIPRYS
jgi:hypothetical protein